VNAGTHRDRIDVASWRAHDHTRALVPVDHEIIDSTSAPRALVLDLASRGAHSERDLFSACAVLGRLIAERGGSPTLAAGTMDGARQALGDSPDAPWLVPARASLLEGFTAARQDIARREAAAGWEYPRCVARLDSTTIAIVAGYPGDDGEAVAGWAARVAQGAALAGVRRAVVADAGPDRAAARAAVLDALDLAGVEVLAGSPARASWLPWLRAPLIK
jgi:hypothetical protein